jgi:hypothetical protein
MSDSVAVDLGAKAGKAAASTAAAADKASSGIMDYLKDWKVQLGIAVCVVGAGYLYYKKYHSEEPESDSDDEGGSSSKTSKTSKKKGKKSKAAASPTDEATGSHPNMGAGGMPVHGQVDPSQGGGYPMHPDAADAMGFYPAQDDGSHAAHAAQ